MDDSEKYFATKYNPQYLHIFEIARRDPVFREIRDDLADTFIPKYKSGFCLDMLDEIIRFAARSMNPDCLRNPADPQFLKLKCL